MRKLSFLFLTLFIISITICCLTACGSQDNVNQEVTQDKIQSSSQNSKPNVIIIFTDDQGYNDVGCFGSEIATPHLDQMAKEGAKLTSFYAAQPICSASRAALLTGCYPNRVGVHLAFMPENKNGLNPAETTIAEMLKDNGYKTGIFGKWHLGDHPNFMPNKQGFDTYFGIPHSNDMWPLHPGQGTSQNFNPLPLFENETIIDTLTDQALLTTQITDRSVEFIKQNKAHPFFLYVAHPQPHVPLYVSDKFKGKSNRGLYGDVIMELDWSVGEILKSLKENNLDENTIVIFTSDNGPWLSYGEHGGSAHPLREGKQTAWEGGQREPCIIRYPDKIPSGATINTALMSIDILPTIAHITNSKLPEKTIDGLNIWDVLNGTKKEGPHEAYFFYYNINELQGVRYKEWKMYYPRSYKSLNGKPGGKGGFPVNYEFNKVETIQLFNLNNDLAEENDLASKHPDLIKKMDGMADKMRAKLGDAFQNIVGSENRQPGKVEW